MALKSTPGRLRAEYGAAVSAQEACGLPRSSITAGFLPIAGAPIQIFLNWRGLISFSEKTRPRRRRGLTPARQGFERVTSHLVPQVGSTEPTLSTLDSFQ